MPCKVWAAFKTYGVRRLGQANWENCCQATYLETRVEMHPNLAVMAPVSLAIVCFRFTDPRLAPAALDAVNGRIVSRLQNSGIAAPSTTTLRGRLVIRVNITNHRTKAEDLNVLIDAVVEFGKQDTAARNAPVTANVGLRSTLDSAACRVGHGSNRPSVSSA